MEDYKITVQEKTELEKLYDKFKDLLYIEDTDLIDLVLATAISRTHTGDKLWLIIIGPSGDGKTELLRTLDNEETTKVIRQLTSKTLVNGYKNKKQHPDLAPKLKDKIVLIPEMACILTLNQEEKRAVWGQLRDLYDGLAGKQSGEGLDIDYKDLNVTLIGCSTPAIDEQVLIHQNLGTRELLYRTQPTNEKLLMKKVIENTSVNIDKEHKRRTLRQQVQQYIKDHPYKQEEVPKEVLEEIKKWAQTISKLRTTAQIDYSTGELRNFLYPEKPTRILNQLITIYHSLKSLTENYSDLQVLNVIQKITESSCSRVRIRILVLLIYTYLSHPDGLSKRDLARDLRIGPKTALYELNILYHLDLIKKIETPTINEEKTYNKYLINEDNTTIKLLAHKYNIEIIKEEHVK